MGISYKNMLSYVRDQKTKITRSLSVMTLAVAGVGLIMGFMPAIASADSVTTNFESFLTGTVNNQDGWSSLGSAGLGCAVYDHAVVSNAGQIYNYPNFGGQSLRISNAVVSGCFSDQTFSKPLINAAGETASDPGSFSVGTLQPHYEAQFDLASTVPTAQQPGLYMSVSPDRGDGARMSYLRFEDQSDGIHVFFDDVTDPTHGTNLDTFNESDIATLNRSVPHTIKFSMDFVAGPDNDVVNIYIDGTLKKTGTSWEDYYRYDTESDPLLNNLSRPVRTLLFRTGGSTNTPSVAGKGFLVDNFSELSSAGLPSSKDQCMNNGWKNYGNTFKNQGDCVSFVATNGKNQPSGH